MVHLHVDVVDLLVDVFGVLVDVFGVLVDTISDHVHELPDQAHEIGKHVSAAVLRADVIAAQVHEHSERRGGEPPGFVRLHR